MLSGVATKETKLGVENIRSGVKNGQTISYYPFENFGDRIQLRYRTPVFKKRRILAGLGDRCNKSMSPR